MIASEVWAIVLASGTGRRFGAAKQHADLHGRTLLEHSVEAALSVAQGVVAVVDDPSLARPDRATVLDDPRVRWCPGGEQRADSVRAGLAAVPSAAEVIVIADAAHPLATPTLFAAVVAAVRSGADGAVPGLPLAEVLARVDADGWRVDGLNRAGLVLVQTPQAFRATALRSAHANGAAAVEDSALVAATGGRIAVVAGDPTNLHVTTPAELDVARRLLG